MTPARTIQERLLEVPVRTRDMPVLREAAAHIDALMAKLAAQEQAFVELMTQKDVEHATSPARVFEEPINAQIARALGWNVWEARGKWFMEQLSETPGHTEVSLVPDYISILRDDVKMRVPRALPSPTGTKES